jgi:hypothetical protein
MHSPGQRGINEIGLGLMFASLGLGFDSPTKQRKIKAKQPHSKAVLKRRAKNKNAKKQRKNHG